MDTTVVNLRVAPFDVYIGRPSKWGNPFSHLHRTGLIHVDTPAEAVRRYEFWIKQQIHLAPDKFDLDELRGQVLGCYCKPGPCHGDILAQLCNEEE